MILPSTEAPSIAPAHDALAQITAILAVASGLAQTGRPLDLTGLEAATGRLCALALDLPPGDGRRLAPALIELRDRLDGLCAALRPPG